MTDPSSASTDGAVPDHVVDVLVIGAGVSGIGAAYRLQQECPDRTYAVLEARDAMGGTWDLFRYPGVRSDSDIYTFSYLFKPWEGDQSLADGEGIRHYIEQVATENGIDQRVRFGRKVVSASWSSEDARWTVLTEPSGADTTDRQPETWSCAFLYACAGYYDYSGGYSPTFPGREDFAGQVVHPQFWPPDLDHAGRRVVVIGSGATAVTLVPAMAGTAEHVTMLQRSPTWITSLPRRDHLADRLRRRLPGPVAHRLIRAKNMAFTLGFYQYTRRRPQAAREFLRKRIAARLGEEYTAEHFTPRYNPWDQRLCVVPDGDLVKAIQRGDASVVTDQIDRFVPEGIRLASGKVLEADLVVTATGLQMQLLSGLTLYVDGRPMPLEERTLYRGLMLDGVPNFAMALGYVNASWPLRADLASRYVCRFLNHLARRGLRYGYPVRPVDLEERPVLPLSSGYVQRALARLPVQGSASPWLMPQNYPLDSLQMRRADLGADMRFGVPPTPRPRPDRGAEARVPEEVAS
jgi:cation diffusion facilitator CzcD-associated flavoprotein CzcO